MTKTKIEKQQPNMSKTKARAKKPTARRKEDFRLLKSMARKEPLAKIAEALKPQLFFLLPTLA